MLTVIFNIGLAIFSVVTCTAMVFLSDMNLLEFLIAITPPIASALFSVILHIRTEIRKKKLPILANMYRLYYFLRAMAEEHIGINMSRKRAGLPPIDTKSSIKSYIRSNEKLITDFLKCFSLKSKTQELLRQWSDNFGAMKTLLDQCKEKLKISDEEESIFQKAKQINNP